MIQESRICVCGYPREGLKQQTLRGETFTLTRSIESVVVAAVVDLAKKGKNVNNSNGRENTLMHKYRFLLFV